jgi:dUTP pyrophosphatase
MNGDLTVPCVTEPDARVPTYETVGSSGADLYASLTDAVYLKPMERRLIPTGIRLEIPAGWEAQVRPRSGLALKHGITCLNTPGTIDSDYRGDIGVILVNLGSQDFAIEHGDRIAQLVFSRVAQANLNWTPQISETDRGTGGFGSTGRK